VRAQALSWLLEASNPSVRVFTLTDVLGKPSDGEDVKVAREKIRDYAPVKELERAQEGRGYWPPGESCYDPKFSATVWQLVILAEMGVQRVPWIESAVERVFQQYLMDDGSLDHEVCFTGHMVRTLVVLGYRDDSRVIKALDWLSMQQLEDGGWNCDYPKHNPRHSSFMSTVCPLWAYSELSRSRLTRNLKRSLERGAEFLLEHRVYKSDVTGGQSSYIARDPALTIHCSLQV
jgi:hypothetical protein